MTVAMRARAEPEREWKGETGGAAISGEVESNSGEQ
jgi:hypothetical protein